MPSSAVLNDIPSRNTRSKVAISQVDYTAIDNIKKDMNIPPEPEDHSQDKHKEPVRDPAEKRKRITALLVSAIANLFDDDAAFECGGMLATRQEEDDADSDTDEDDDEDDDGTESSWKDPYTYEEVEYLEKLSEIERTEMVMHETALRDYNRSTIPLRFRILNSNLPECAKFSVLRRLDQAEECAGGDAGLKLGQWVDGLADIPFGKFSSQVVKLTEGHAAVYQFLLKTHKYLNASIFGHTIAKSQILEYVTQQITNPSATGKCLAIQGPPGNGKTTLIRNGLAKALGRPFSQISLGGMSDVAVLNGHDFTYEGSQCGRICAMIKEAGVMNPIIYFDELDKVSATSKGDDIYNFLCHLTDFSQNHVYQDKYFDGIDIDLSQAIFIFSFNDITRINPILLDRLHVIHTKGFNSDEKVKIAQDYLIPSQLTEFGFAKEDISFPEDVLKTIVHDHCQDEQGVRKLKRAIESVLSRFNILRFIKGDHVSGEESIKLPYDIPSVSFPLVVSHDHIKVLLKDFTIVERTFLSLYN
jgi:ATP-dependent Lon protease